MAGNHIGTDKDGATALANHGIGVMIEEGAHHNTIGGDTPGAGNLISGNTAGGIVLVDAGVDGNVVAGNLIGTDASAGLALPNGSNGVVIAMSARGTIASVATQKARPM